MRLTTVLQAKRHNILEKIGELSKAFGNFPDSYVKRASEQVYWETPKKPQYTRATIEKKNFRFTTNRPWTSQFRMQNMSNMKRKKVFVEPIENWGFFRGDRVEVLVGKDKGKQGIVNQVIQERNWVMVEGLNCHLRIVGKEKDYPGVVIRSEAPLLVTSQVALVDPTDLQATEVEWRFTEEGEKVRVSKRTGRIIPIPKANEETMDYKGKKLYMTREKDTDVDVAQEITFKPKLCTFEMDIMESMGIEEDRIPKKTFCVLKRFCKKTIKTEVSKQQGTEHRGSSGRNELPEIRAWIPPSLRPQHGLTEEAQRDEIFRKVRGILNKLTPEKFQKLSDDLLALNLNSKKILLGVIHLIFEKALDEPKYSSMYAQLCRRISKEGSTLEESDSRYTFETLLIRVCQDKFVNRSQYSLKIINSTADNDIDEEERRYIAKQKILGNVKFIGELFKLEMLNEATLHKMLEQLLDKKSRPYPNLDDRCEDMECLSQIFRTCGRNLDTEKSKNLIDQYFDNMEHKSNSFKYPPRIRFMLRDIIELRRDGWKPRKVARIEGPVPIQDLSTDEEYIRQQRDLRTRNMEFPSNRNSGDRSWMDKLPLSLQSMNNYQGTLSMTSSSSIISGPFNPNSYNSGRDSLMSTGGGYRNNNSNNKYDNGNNSNNHHHHNNGRPMNKYNNNDGNKMNHNKYEKYEKYEKYDKYDKYDKMKHHRQHDNSNNHHGGSGGGHHMNNQNSYNKYDNNNMLSNKELAPRFKRNLVTTTTTNSVDDLQMRPAPNSLLFKASNIKSNPQQLPLNQQNRSTTSSPGFSSSSNVDNLIPPFNSAMQVTTMNGKQQQQQHHHHTTSSQQYNQSSLPPQQNQQINYTTAAASAAQKQSSSNSSQNTASSQPQSPQNNNQLKDQHSQQPVTKQGSVEKQKTKKDKGPSRDDVLKKVIQFINDSLLEKKFMDKLHDTRNKDKDAGNEKELITDSHNNNSNNGHENGKVEIIEECNDITSNKENDSLNDSITEEEISVPTMEDVVKLYYDLKVPDKFLKDSIVKILNESLDKGDQAQETVIEFLIAMQKDKKLTANQTIDAFRGMINGMNEREKTIPKITTHVASLLSRAMSKKICKLTDIANHTDNGQHYPLLLLVFQQLHKNIGEDALVEMFNNSKINLMSNLPECDRTKDRLAEILDDRKLSFLQPLLRIESELWRQIKEDPQPQTFYKWIKDNVNPVRYTDPGFITALISVLLKYITQETTFPENSDPTKLPEKQQVEAEKKLLVSFSRILNAFLNGNLDLQLIAVYALQVFCFNSQFPKGMLLRWFTALYELEIVEEDAFLRWKEDITDDYPGKGKALFQVNSWLTWLQEAESEEEDDE